MERETSALPEAYTRLLNYYANFLFFCLRLTELYFQPRVLHITVGQAYKWKTLCPILTHVTQVTSVVL